MDLKPGYIFLVKADTFQGKRKIKDSWEDKHHEVVHQIATDIPLYEVMVTHPTPQPTPPLNIRNWQSLVCRCLPSTGQMYQPHPCQTHSWRSDSEITP